jgi:hypothetical protein
MKIWLQVLVCIALIGCASDGQFYKTELFNGDYEEVVFELGYDIDFQKNGAMYGNYKLGMLAMFNLYPSESSMEYVIEYTELEDQDPDKIHWSQVKIAKTFFFKSAQAGFSPAMLRLAGLINTEDNGRFGESYYWLEKAASKGNSEAYEILKSRNIDIQKLSTPEVVSKHIHLAREIDSQFTLHNPVLAARRKRETDEEINNALATIGKVLAAVAIVAIAEKYSSSSESSYDQKAEDRTSSGIDYDSYHKRARRLGNRVKDSDGNCGCPYDKATDGSRCGSRSAWSKPKGETPNCDTSLINIEEYEEMMRLRG